MSEGTDAEELGKGLEFEGPKPSVEEGMKETALPASQLYLGWPWFYSTNSELLLRGSGERLYYSLVVCNSVLLEASHHPLPGHGVISLSVIQRWGLFHGRQPEAADNSTEAFRVVSFRKPDSQKEWNIINSSEHVSFTCYAVIRKYGLKRIWLSRIERKYL